MSSSILQLLFLAVCAVVAISGQATKCTADVCETPECVCSSSVLPYGNWTVEDTPQMVILVFEGSLNDATFKTYYVPIFDGIQNSNGCPAHGTFFIDHKYSDYASIHKAWSAGHDFGVQSITGAAWSSSSSVDTIYNELAGEKYFLELYGQLSDVLGVRAPSGVSGGDVQFQALSQAELLFDDTLLSRSYGNPYWPYTLDYKTTQDCQSGPCPTQSFPGIWEFPVTDFIDGNNVICSNLFSCIYNNSMPDAYSLLDGNFQYHLPQATPFLVPIPLTWLYDTNNTAGLHRFLTEVVARPNTYLLTLNQALAWFQDPVPADQVAGFEPWGCDEVRPSDCSTISCKFTVGTEQINFNFCSSANATYCPDEYPWIDNLPWTQTAKQ